MWLHVPNQEEAIASSCLILATPVLEFGGFAPDVIVLLSKSRSGIKLISLLACSTGQY